MPLKSIPPKTMSSVRKERTKAPGAGGTSIKISVPTEWKKHSSEKVTRSFKGKEYKKPRQWQYITKPFFKRIREPVVDVFKEAEEIQIIIDLGNFRKGELNFGVHSKKYHIHGKHEDCEFREEILLPYDVDIKKIKEIFRNDILEITLPKKKKQKKRRKK